MTTSMKAIVANGYGSPEVLQLQKVSIPTPKENEVLVRVHAASATRADSQMRTGTPYAARLFTGLRKPKNPIPGTGFAGEVAAKGKEVKNFNIGDRVFGETTLGFSTNAEYVAVPVNGVILPMPEGMPFADAASICDGPLTSYNFLKEIGEVKPGQKVLINGASGSLGSAAVQLAKYLGAEVTGVCSSRNIGMVKSLGADKVIDYTRQNFTETEERYDLVYDTIGKSSFSASRNILKEGGTYLSPVLQTKLLVQMMWTAKFGSKKAIFGATGLRSDDELRALLEEVIVIYREGKLQSIIDRQFPLEKVRDAHAYIDRGHKKGNVIITVR